MGKWAEVAEPAQRHCNERKKTTKKKTEKSTRSHCLVFICEMAVLFIRHVAVCVLLQEECQIWSYILQVRMPFRIRLVVSYVRSFGVMVSLACSSKNSRIQLAYMSLYGVFSPASFRHHLYSMHECLHVSICCSFFFGYYLYFKMFCYLVSIFISFHLFISPYFFFASLAFVCSCTHPATNLFIFSVGFLAIKWENSFASFSSEVVVAVAPAAVSYAYCPTPHVHNVVRSQQKFDKIEVDG